MKKIALMALLSAVVSVSAAGQVTVTPYKGYEWIHPYANPFTGGETYDWDKANWVNPTEAYALSRVVDFNFYRRGSTSRLTSTYSGWQLGDWTWFTLTTFNQQPIRVGTVITTQSVWSGANAAMPYTLRIGSDGTATDWGSIAAYDGPGTVGKNVPVVHTLDRVGEYNAFRVDVKSVTNNSAGLADFSQIIVLPDRLEQITSVSCNAPSASNNDIGTWWTTTTPASLVFTFEDLQQVDAIVIWGVDNGDAVFTIKDGNGTPLVDVSMINRTAAGSGVKDFDGWMVPLQFDKSLYTDKIIFEFKMENGAQYNGLHEVMFLKAVPEPATMSLLALGGLAMLRRKK